MRQTVAGDCNGSHCGCYNHHCWSYVKDRRNTDGVSWCYTQSTDSTSARSQWQRCDRDHDCYGDRPCNDFIQQETSESKSQNDTYGWNLLEWWGRVLGFLQ
ncbi:unnamed protein product [Adineta ricciae]|uniref:Uncharacterized protein n=1 Tax=Adineta ricciae TaxID=249248 RepID=A0A814HPE5_ADIRI|nr:unnamed protein product [Adineta ricciae]